MKYETFPNPASKSAGYQSDGMKYWDCLTISARQYQNAAVGASILILAALEIALKKLHDPVKLSLK